jgi:hypothetical protein
LPAYVVWRGSRGNMLRPGEICFAFHRASIS